MTQRVKARRKARVKLRVKGFGLQHGVEKSIVSVSSTHRPAQGSHACRGGVCQIVTSASSMSPLPLPVTTQRSGLVLAAETASFAVITRLLP